jgi:hypothetical protein
VELTQIRMGSTIWWTLGFEATGPAGTLRRTLETTAALVFANAPPGGVAFGMGNSRSYTEWLGLPPDTGQPHPPERWSWGNDCVPRPLTRPGWRVSQHCLSPGFPSASAVATAFPAQRPHLANAARQTTQPPVAGRPFGDTSPVGPARAGGCASLLAALPGRPRGAAPVYG